MRTSLMILSALALVAGHLPAAELPAPLIDLPLAGSLANRGSLGGEAAFAEYAPGEGPLYDLAPFGEGVDFTRASRHGGTLGEHATPAGGAVVFPGDRLAGIDCFTIVVWARQNPTVEGVSARLAMTETGWDLLPAPRGVALSFLEGGEKKTNASLNAAPFDRGRLPALTDWRFTAVAVGRETVCGYLGGLTTEPVALRPAPRPGPLQPAWGNLVIGNLMQIRPFNGWMARFRLYDRALSAAEIAEIAAADRAAAATAAGATLQPRPDPARPLVFRRSAIPFSTRWQRPDALAVMDSFHATDCLWVYGSKQDYVAALQATGRRYQGALNGLQGTAKATPGKASAGDTSGRHEDLDGNKNMPTWMVTFKPPHYTGCCNQPAFRELFFADAKAYVDLGVDMIHVDDSALNASWVAYAGVCFCDACRAGFREHLRRLRTPDELKALGVAAIDGFDYREHLRGNGIADAATYRKQFKTLPLTPDFIAFQAESTRAFYRDFRARLDAWSPTKHIAISVNEGIVLPVADAPGRLVHADLIDFYHGEAYDRSFAANLTGGKTAEALGLQHVSTPVLQGVADGARTLALAYALGQFQLVPWDVYMGSDETGSSPRYNGTREDFGAFYDLIQAQPQLFDSARSLAQVGVLVNADEATTPRVTGLCERLALRQVPFHLLVTATRQARVPLREADLRCLRVLIAFSPVDGLPLEDRASLDRVLAEKRLRLLSPEADLDAFLSARGLDTLAFEGPPGIALFPRLAADGTLLIHAVNWNLSADPRRPEVYDHVTVSLRHPPQWGPVARATYWQPGQAAAELTPEPHADSLRLTLPRLETWGILALARTGEAPR
jgi:hypothetical protein